ncbi:MAG: bifunctional adenosylcobinamide kinase/adenosylcobinamide-phosphate guanylyltransferase [Lachnospiraceae bacterium]|nr:bifunctional adenosylcobinamide kinase/adenosylcobinamide-phosphate guanylyltransferase [Lachnospiraceae bacterium]
MSKIILVTGGSRSGKSVLAEEKAFEYGEGSVIYLATAIPTDDDMKERIRLHQERRDSRWDTHEGFKDLPEVLKTTEKSTALLDCITVFITNFLFDEERDFDQISKEEIAALQEQIIAELKRIVSTAKDNDKNLIIVTNEVGMSLVPSYRLGRIFSDINGKANEILAKMADEVYFSVCGIPMKLK